jgi:hypothetical protein
MPLTPLKERCEQCGQPLWVACHGHRKGTTLSGVWKLTLVGRQGIEPSCPRFHQRYRPEEEGRWALPHGEFGLEVLALIGPWRFREPRRVPQMHQALRMRDMRIAHRRLTHLMQRYEELLALRVSAHQRIQARLQKPGHVILAIDGLQPDVGARQCSGSCGTVSGKKSCWRVPGSVVEKRDLTALLREVKDQLKQLAVPVKGVISAGEETIGRAVAFVFPKVPHQLGQFH